MPYPKKNAAQKPSSRSNSKSSSEFSKRSGSRSNSNTSQRSDKRNQSSTNNNPYYKAKEDDSNYKNKRADQKSEQQTEQRPIKRNNKNIIKSPPKGQGERIQKKLANLGLGSRREIERLIEQGLVKVNHQKATLGQMLKGDEIVHVKHRKIVLSNVNVDNKQRIIAYHKPLGVVCTRRDEKDRKTAFSDLPKIKNARWVMVGRLDINTAGLLLFTNDGQLANQLMHPSSEIQRVYLVRVFGEVTKESLHSLLTGVTLDDDSTAHFDDIQMISGNDDASNNHYLVSLSEGKNREVRKLWEAVNCQVSRLKRVEYGSFALPKVLKQGKTYELSPKEVKQLKQEIAPKSDIAKNS